jgi:hypothetical protein
MKYFMLETDKSNNNLPQIIDWYSRIDERNMIPERYQHIQFRTMMKMNANASTDFNALIVKPFLLLNGEAKELLSKFEPNMQYKEIILVNQPNHLMNQYFFPLLEVVDCLTPDSERNMDHSNLVKGKLDKSKLEDQAIFMLSELKNRHIVIRMDLAEALLRRSIYGYQLNEIEVVN